MVDYIGRTTPELPKVRKRDRDRAEALRLAGGPKPSLRDRAVALANERGVVRTRDLTDIGVPRCYLARMREEGLLIKVGYGQSRGGLGGGLTVTNDKFRRASTGPGSASCSGELKWTARGELREAWIFGALRKRYSRRPDSVPRHPSHFVRFLVNWCQLCAGMDGKARLRTRAHGASVLGARQETSPSPLNL